MKMLQLDSSVSFFITTATISYPIFESSEWSNGIDILIKQYELAKELSVMLLNMCKIL